MTLHDELRALVTESNDAFAVQGETEVSDAFICTDDVEAILARHPTPTVSEPAWPVTDHKFQGTFEDECTFRNDGTDLTYCGEPKDAHQLQVQAPVGDSLENVTWVCINPDAPEHPAHSVRLKMEAWGTCDYQGHREVALENGVSDGEREALRKALIDGGMTVTREHGSDDPAEWIEWVNAPVDAVLDLAAGYRKPTLPSVEELCEVMHDAYESAAIAEGWETQERSRVPWSDVPEANKRTMRAAVASVLDLLKRGA